MASECHDASQDFAKAGASTVLMPVWSEDELQAAGQWLYNLTEQEVHTLFAKWGGSARYVLQYARDPRRQMDLDIAIANATTDMIFKGMGESGSEVSSSLTHRSTLVQCQQPVTIDCGY